MKRKIAIALLVCFLLSLLTIASAASVKLAVKGGSICLRTGPGGSYSVRAYLKDGQKITVLSTGSSWSKVKTSTGKEGYIKNLYISGIGKLYADGTTYVANKYKAVVKTSDNSKITMRAGASSSTGNVGTVKSGSTVTVLGSNGSWTLISTSSGTQGFINTKFLSDNNNKSSAKNNTATVNASGLYMRKGPAVTYDIITCVKRGGKVTVLSKANRKWWLVSYGKYSGYMYSGYLK